MDQSSLKNSDVLILTGLTQMPTANPDGMLGEFCSNLGRLKLKRKVSECWHIFMSYNFHVGFYYWLRLQPWRFEQEAMCSCRATPPAWYTTCWSVCTSSSRAPTWGPRPSTSSHLLPTARWSSPRSSPSGEELFILSLQLRFPNFCNLRPPCIC